MRNLHLRGLVFCQALWMSSLFGQTDSGRIVGVVTDSSGAVVSNAVVTVKNERTGAEQRVTTDAQGFYIATQLQPATYTVTGSADGFAASEYKELKLQVGQELTRNIVLRPAGVASEITVSGGELVQVDTSSARVGVIVSGREVAELPINGRQVSQLYLLAPGAVNNAGGNFDN